MSGTESHRDTSGDRTQAYWKANLRELAWLLAIWFTCSFGFGIVLAEPLNAFSFLGVPLGFWFAQQGAIYIFIVLIFVYAWRMHRVDERFGLEDDNEPDSYDLDDAGGETQA
jgi:putative solute:sodium symporter small subunit